MRKPSIESKWTLELTTSRDPKDYYIVKVWLEDECLLAIWCDRISVYNTEPPTYCLYCGGANITALSSKLMIVRPQAMDLLPKATIIALGKYVRVESDITKHLSSKQPK